MTQRPSKPALKAFVTVEEDASPRASSVPPTTAKRAPPVNEAILERATAKLEALSDHFDRLVIESPTKEDLKAVYNESRQTRRLLEEHLAHDREDRLATNRRLDGIMGLLGEILGRLPVPTPVESAPPSTQPERA